MKALDVAVAAAVGAVAAWGLKAVAIGVAGGLDESPLEAPLFFVGLVATVVAYVAAGVAAVGGRPIWKPILGGVAGIVVGLGVLMLIENGVGSLVPESAGWVKEEAGLWAVSLLTAGALLGWRRRRHQHVAEVVV
ncbi:MAG: hypothetical protein GEU93_08255 [Propionibacteriales bacterium]|nr:hypothetical protein [Propionibacteriales bacterium]